jgi:DNA-binding response OmpR family regulator
MTIGMGTKVLIVEDDQDIALMLGVRLKARDYEVALARDAVTAVGVARKEDPDLILLDINLPGGDGFLILDRLRALDSLALKPVIVVSAHASAENAERALQGGARRFLSKPIDMAELLAAIAEVLASPA